MNTGGVQLVFDIGGTNLRVARCTEDEITDVRIEDTPDEPRAAAERVSALAHEVAGGAPVSSIAGGVAGVISPDGVIVFSPNLSQWNDFDLGGYLRAQVCEHVVIRNDGDLGGLGEAVFGAGREHDIVVYLSVGTGVGGGRIVNKRIDVYAHGFEPGHQVLDYRSRARLEDLVSGHAVEAAYGAKPKTLPQSVWDELTPVLAAGVYNTVLHWSPDVVILGGSMMNPKAGFNVEHVAQAVEEYRKVLPAIPDFAQAELGDSVVLYGAAAMERKVRAGS